MRRRSDVSSTVTVREVSMGSRPGNRTMAIRTVVERRARKRVALVRRHRASRVTSVSRR